MFERCRKKKLYLKLSKSMICAQEIPCLGDFVGRDRVRIDPDKVRVVREWPPKPFGTCSHSWNYRLRAEILPSLLEISAPLFEMVKRRTKKELEWTPDRVEAFEALKDALSKTPVLALPDFSKPFLLRTGASRFAVGGVLLQHVQASDGTGEVEKPVAFCGRKMNSAELNYPTHEQEMLAIVHCLNIWHVYLLDGGCGGNGSSLPRARPDAENY